MTRLAADPATFDPTRGTLTVDGTDVLMCKDCQFYLDLWRTEGPITGPQIPCKSCTAEIKRKVQPPGSALRDLSDAQLQAFGEMLQSEQQRRSGKGRPSAETEAVLRTIMKR